MGQGSNFAEIPATEENDLLRVVIESPRGSTTKIKWEPTLGVFTLSRPLPLGVSYPHDWGFVPSTRAPDGDPLDALVLSEGTTFPGVLIRARPIGVLRLEQNRRGRPGRERNDRLIAVPASAARQPLRSADELGDRVKSEIERFFLDITVFEKKDVTMLGWGGPDDAWALVKASVAAHARKDRA